MNTILRTMAWVIMLLPVIFFAVIWKQLPPVVPTHYDLKGNINSYGTKQEMALIVMIVASVNVLLYLLLFNVYKLDPRKGAVMNKQRLHRLAFIVCCFVSFVLTLIIYDTLHAHVAVTVRLVLAAMGLLFALVGNNMYNIRSNYFAGMRLPWTLESEDNWRQTHHFAGRLWFFGGLILCVFVLFLSEKAAVIVSISGLLLLVIIPMIYSYKLYRASKQAKMD